MGRFRLLERSTDGGTLIPKCCTRNRCRARASVVSAGSTATWKPKKRVRVAPVTSSPPRRKVSSHSPISGTAAVISVPTLVAKKASSFQGSRYPLKPNPRKRKKSTQPLTQVSSRGRR